MKKYFIVPHTHWDREWHKTFQENRVRLIRFMDDLMETLEQMPEYSCFVLDGQTSLIGDYLEVKPEREEQIGRLISEGRIAVGPWYVQPDENLPCLESIIRNLLISRKISDRYGPAMSVGYLPDSFGQSASMPAILSGFGIEYALFYRGFSEEDAPHNEFLWSSPDGSTVFAAWMPTGYGNGMFLSEELEKSVEEIEGSRRLLGPRSINGNLLLMCGSDQCFTKKFLPDTCSALNRYYKNAGEDIEVLLATPQEYMESLRDSRDHLCVVWGELRKGKRSRVHISIGATRMDIKKANFDVECKYRYLLEPLSVLVKLMGGEDNTSLIQRGWRYIVENHAHDSICCVCTDAIHREMLQRIAAAEQIADCLVKGMQEDLVRRIRFAPEKGRPVLIFSSTLSKRRDLVRVDVCVKDEAFCLTDSKGTPVLYDVNGRERINLKDTKVGLTPLPDDIYKKFTIEFFADIEGAGYSTFYLKEGAAPAVSERSMVNGHIMENELVRVEICDDGTLTITDKENGRIYDKQHILSDGGNAGDEYDYSPCRGDYEVFSRGNMKAVKLTADTPLKAAFQIFYCMSVPETTAEDGRSASKVSLEIETEVMLHAGEKQIYFTTTIHNNARNHRIQAGFDLGGLCRKHFADVQTGEIMRNHILPETAESECGWSERYYSIYSQQKYCGVQGANGRGFIVMNRGIPQYEVGHEETTALKLTLLSSVGVMGNENLLYRKGRRSGAVCSTPDSQMIGDITVEYSFLPLGTGTNYRSLADRYVNRLNPVSYPEYSADGIMPEELCMVKGSDDMVLSALKPAEDGEGSILRILNPGREARQNAGIWVNPWLFGNVSEVNLAEEVQEDQGIRIKRENNPDGSDKARFQGEIQFGKMPGNSMRTLKLN